MKTGIYSFIIWSKILSFRTSIKYCVCVFNTYGDGLKCRLLYMISLNTVRSVLFLKLRERDFFVPVRQNYYNSLLELVILYLN